VVHVFQILILLISKVDFKCIYLKGFIENRCKISEPGLPNLLIFEISKNFHFLAIFSSSEGDFRWY